MTVRAGRGEMPGFRDLDDTATSQLYDYLTGLGSSMQTSGMPLDTSKVVASGGAPGGLDVQKTSGEQYTPLGGPACPAGTDTPKVRYYTNWGLYPDKPWVISPRWSPIVAYDLNTGTSSGKCTSARTPPPPRRVPATPEPSWPNTTA